jgi:hypothetical protein
MPLTNENREAIELRLRSCMSKCSPPMNISKDKPGVFELIGNKPVPYGSKKAIVPGMYFCSFVTRKDMISFYFFPMYMNEKPFLELMPGLIKSLKGKTCFNFKKPEQIAEKELAAVLKKGVQIWKELGYMK